MVQATGAFGYATEKKIIISKPESPEALLHIWSLDCCILDYFGKFWKSGFH